MSDFKNKKIILAVPNHFGLPEVFQKNLEFLGFEVFQLELNLDHKLNIKDTLIHFYNKTIKKNRLHKAKIKAKKSEILHIEFLNKLPQKIDFCLIIRPDLYSENVIKKITERVELSAAYQWDGMDRFPLAKNYIEYFDNFFVFDENDALKYPKCIHTTNFYFDDDIETCEIDTDVFFVGSFMKNRIYELLQLSLFFDKLKLKTKLFLHLKKLSKAKKYKNSSIIFTKKFITFKENIELLKKSKIVLDFKNDIHNGLSLRTFEAIGFEKKLISNNSLVQNYSFYNTNNIFLLENNFDEEELKKFLSSPYQQLPEETKSYYSFSHWIKRTLKK